MDRIYDVTDHPVLVDVKREVLYTTLLDKPLEEYIRIFFLIRYYKLVNDVKTPITGMSDKEEFIEANNNRWVDNTTGDLVVPTKDTNGNDITTGLTNQYDYFVSLFDVATPSYNLYDVIKYRIQKHFSDGLFDSI